MHHRRIVTLATDFGVKDPYAAEMKAVILSLCPEANIVDVSHGVEKFNVKMGAYVLASAAPFFPKGTIHVAVVDPGVGTGRKAICIETEHGFLVGPDNGVLSLAAEKDSIKHVYSITNQKLIQPKVSATFHGRDIFSPAAAHLANGSSASELGSEIKHFTKLRFVKSMKKTGELTGEVIYIDDFGNVVTSIHGKDMISFKGEKNLIVGVGGSAFKVKLCRTYGEVGRKQLLGLVGSQDLFELSVNRGSAKNTLKVSVGDSITMETVRKPAR